METERKNQAEDLGLSQTELSFYNILISELTEKEDLNEEKIQKVKNVVQDLVQMLDDATQIVGFFEKWDEQKRVRRNIKRSIITNFDESLVKVITERFMELVETKFK